MKSILFSRFDTFTLIAGDISGTADNNTNVGFINCGVFATCETEIKGLFKQKIILNLRQKVLNQVFEIILTHFFSYRRFFLVTGDSSSSSPAPNEDLSKISQ